MEAVSLRILLLPIIYSVNGFGLMRRDNGHL
jgi:hypothetical protein